MKSDSETNAAHGPEQKTEGKNVVDCDGETSFCQLRGMKTSDLTNHPGNKRTKEVLFCQVNNV